MQLFRSRFSVDVDRYLLFFLQVRQQIWFLEELLYFGLPLLQQLLYYCFQLHNGPNNTTHTNQNIVIYFTAMNNRIMTYWNIIANMSWSGFKSSMNYNTILNINFIAYPNWIYISPYNSLVPNRNLITYLNITDKCRVFCKKTI